MIMGMLSAVLLQVEVLVSFGIVIYKWVSWVILSTTLIFPSQELAPSLGGSLAFMEKLNLLYKMWDMHKSICFDSSLPWFCIGEFNEVLRAEEHIGVGHRTQSQMIVFRNTVNSCGLSDLGHKGRF